jgi:uncharacterized protein (TIGR02145 family)
MKTLLKLWAATVVILLMAAGALAQDLPKIAVYITNDSTVIREKKSLMTRIQSKLVKSGRYKVIERSDTFLAEIEEEHLRQRSGDIDDSQISKLGKQYGAQFVCIVDIMSSVGTFDVSARVINVETVEIINIGYCFSSLQTPYDLEKATEELAKQLLGEQPMLAQKPKSETEPTQESKPVPVYADWLDKPQASILIATLPSLADIYIDDRFIGKANSGELQVPAGTHLVRFVKDGIDKTTTMTFSQGKNPTQYIPLNRESAALWKSSPTNTADQPKPEPASKQKPRPAGQPTPASVTTFIDKRDGQAYRIVKVGSQTWFAENLNYVAEGSKCPGNNSSNCEKYGRLYDWATAKKACPAGWHLPTDDEWTKLMNYVGGLATAGTKLKSSSYWNSYSGVPAGTDEYGFSALPGGSGSSDGSFGTIGSSGYWWSATPARIMYKRGSWRWYMHYNSESMGRGASIKTDLLSVRCVRVFFAANIPTEPQD